MSISTNSSICPQTLRRQQENAQRSCCNSSQAPLPPWLKKVDLICRIALGALAALLAPVPFSISFSLGLVIGTVYAAERYLRKKPMFPEGESKPVCAQGYMDFLSGMRFPPIIGSLATATFIGAHMRHDPVFYVPFCGLFIGLWTGRESVTLLKDLSGRAYSYFHPKTNMVQQPKKCCCACVKT